MRLNKRILVVDDNPINLMILEEALTDEFHLQYAGSGNEALKVAKRFRPAAILLDVMMPEMDGLETCRRLRCTEGLRHTPIIMVSAKAMPSERVAGIDAGADDYITKPFDEVELLEVIRRYVDRCPNCVIEFN